MFIHSFSHSVQTGFVNWTNADLTKKETEEQHDRIKQEVRNLSVTPLGLPSTKFSLVTTKAEWLREKVQCGLSVCV